MQYRWRWLDILHDVFHCAGRKMQLMWHMHRMGNRRCNSKLSFVSFLQSARRNRLRRQRNPWIFDKSCLVFCLTFLALEYWFEKKTCCYFDIVFFFHVKTSPRGGARLFCSRWFSSSHRPILRLHSIEWLFKGEGDSYALSLQTTFHCFVCWFLQVDGICCTCITIRDGLNVYNWWPVDVWTEPFALALWLFASFCFSSFCTLRARWRFQKKPWHKKKTIWTWVLRGKEKTLPAHDSFVWRRQLDVDFSETMI